MTIYFIYKHTSPSGKSYIGQTLDLEHREICHKREDNPCRAFRNAIKKYGWNNFTHDIIACCTGSDNTNITEQLLITEHNTLAPGGYNLTAGGTGGRRSAETRARMSAAQKGRQISPEHRRKLSEINRGKTVSDVTKQKIAVKKKDPEYMAKWKASRAANRPIKQYTATDPTGVEHTITFMREFCEQHGLLSSAMQAVARGLHTHHKGWACMEVTRPASP